MEKLFFLFIYILISLGISAQDTLILRKNNSIPASVLEIGTETIRYKKADNITGPDYVVRKKEVRYIIFRSGKKEAIDSLDHTEEAQTSPVVYVGLPGSSANSTDMFRNGARDAKMYYTHSCGAVATGISSFAIGIFGLIPAIAISGTPPKDKNLGYPNAELWKTKITSRSTAYGY